MRRDISWIVTVCKVVEVYGRFGGEYCLYFQGQLVKTKIPEITET
jgi:hypothetical protein